MNKRNFIKSLGVMAVGCLMATGLSWKPEKLARKVVVNPEWVNAEYEIRFAGFKGAEMFFYNEWWPARSNNPNALRDKDFIAPFVTVDT